MTTCFLAPDPVNSTFLIPGSNTPGNGVKVFFYQNKTTTKQTTYKDSAAGSAWSNPQSLDSGGNWPNAGSVYFAQGNTYTVVWAPANDTDPPSSPYRTVNDLQGTNDVANQTGSEWLLAATTPSLAFVSASTFTMLGDQTAVGAAEVGRRMKLSVAGPTVYGYVSSAVYASGSTTVNLVLTDSAVDAGLNAAYWALLSATKNSVPWLPGGRSLFMDTVDTSKHALITLSTLPSSTTANIVLTSTGVKGASWDVLLHTSVSNLSTLTVANLTAYDTYTMYMQNFQPDTDGVFLRIRLSPDNGSTFVSTTVYSDVQKIIGIDGNTYNEVDNSAASFFIGNSSTNPINGPGASRPNFGVAGKITFYNLAATTSAKIMSGEGMYQGTAAAAGFNVQGLANASSGINVTSVNALQFLFSAGNISTGVLDVYGIKNG